MLLHIKVPRSYHEIPADISLVGGVCCLKSHYLYQFACYLYQFAATGLIRTLWYLTD